MKTTKLLFAIASLLIVASACKKEKVGYPKADLNVVAAALDTFATTLKATVPTEAELGPMIRSYLQTHQSYFYGSTVTLLDSTGKATGSPYFYRHNGSIDSTSLMTAAYKIDSQDWLRQPIAYGHAIWTEPYYDAGGGEIWMRTRSVPVYTTTGKLFAVATTDVQVDKP